MSGNYEISDIRSRGIFWGISLLVLSMAVTLILVWFTFAGFRQIYGSRDASRSRVELPAEEPPAPRLEIDPTANFDEYARAQMKILSSYGWAAKEQGRAHIPIERAMELLLERK
jgi:hypothetical protein